MAVADENWAFHLHSTPQCAAPFAFTRSPASESFGTLAASPLTATLSRRSATFRFRISRLPIGLARGQLSLSVGDDTLYEGMRARLGRERLESFSKLRPELNGRGRLPRNDVPLIPPVFVKLAATINPEERATPPPVVRVFPRTQRPDHGVVRPLRRDDRSFQFA